MHSRLARLVDRKLMREIVEPPLLPILLLLDTHVIIVLEVGLLGLGPKLVGDLALILNVYS